MARGEVKPEDFSSEINAELDQLIALGECFRELPDPAEIREGFFNGLAYLIQGCADRINKMLDPTYEKLYQDGLNRGRQEFETQGKGPNKTAAPEGE
jgi:hypothetical protein